MHRTSISLAITVVLLISLSVTSLRGASAQDATPQATPVTVPAWVQAWLDAYVVEDPAAFAALYTPDGVYEDVPSGQAAHGREAIAESAAGFMEHQDDYAFTPLAFFEGDGWAVLEYDSAATDPESGVRITGIRIATIFQLEDGLISRSSDYYDFASYLTQLGLIPGSGTPVPEAATPTP